MTIQKRRFILRLVRLQNAVDDSHARWEAAYERDSAVDGGEFCGPAIARSMQDDAHRLAVRFGFADFTVAETVAEHLDVEVRRPAVCYGYPAPLPR